MTSLYSAVGPVLTHYEVDVDGAALVRRDSVTLPENVQYVWPHPSRRYLYAISSDRGTGTTGDRHFLSALRVADGGALALHGPAVPLVSRPLHLTLDAGGAHALLAYNVPGRVTVHRIAADGTLGAEVAQPAGLDLGIYPHQVRMLPSGREVVLVTRGNNAAGAKPEEPGALKLYDYRDGVLANRASVAPGGGYGFGPRHLDFHPREPWVYVSLERQNQLDVFRIEAGTLVHEPSFRRPTLTEPGNVRPRQLAGTVHVHPNGRTVYVANRADHTVEADGVKVYGGGENTLVAWTLDARTGAPTHLQTMATHGYHVRTFALDPTGRVLVAASVAAMQVREGSGTVTVAAGLSVFRVGEDGRLAYARRYDVETPGRTQFWAGIV